MKLITAVGLLHRRYPAAVVVLPAVLCWAIALFLVYSVLTMGGCVAAGYESYDRTTTKADGTVVREKGRRASYTDNREGAKAAGDFVMGEGGLLESLGPWGKLATGGGVLGALGLAARKWGMHAGERRGEERGWKDARETYSLPPGASVVLHQPTGPNPDEARKLP